MVTFEHMRKRYGGSRDALRDLNFSVAAGELVFVTGHSGAGKSTLLRLLMGMEKATHGRVSVGGQDLAVLNAHSLPLYRRSLGTVFQDHRLLFDRSVLDNVALPLKIKGFTDQDIRKRAQAALDKVGLLDKAALGPEALSGGEQQRVGIARAVAHRPSLLLADEPTGNLDPQLSASIMQLFAQFGSIGVTCIIATHDIELVRASRLRRITLEQGEVVQDLAAAPLAPEV